MSKSLSSENSATCGKGLAEHAALPAAMGRVIGAVAEVLELHLKALDLSDELAKKEHGVYEALAEEHRKIAAQLLATAAEMSRNRDLPMARHDMKAMANPRNGEAFEQLVRLEEELLRSLTGRVEQDRRMLFEIGGSRR